MKKVLKQGGSEITRNDLNKKQQYLRERIVRPANSAQMMKMPTISSFKEVKLHLMKVTTILMVNLHSRERRVATTKLLWSTDFTVGHGILPMKVALETRFSGSTTPHYLVPLYLLVLRGEG